MLFRSDLSDLAAFAETVCGLYSEESADAYRIACDDAGEVLSGDDFHKTYQGTYPSVEDYCEETALSFYGFDIEATKWPFTCIDWSRAWRELSYDGYSYENAPNGMVHIFRSV